MKYTVDGWNNYCRVFELPVEFPKGFCTGGGLKTNFQMVDWFNPVQGLGTPAVSKETYIEKVGEFTSKVVTIDYLYESLIPFIRKKIYIKPNREYIIVCKFGACILFTSGL